MKGNPLKYIAQRMMTHCLCVYMRVCVWVCVSVCAAWVYLYRGGGHQGHIIAANVYRGNCYVCYTSNRGGGYRLTRYSAWIFNTVGIYIFSWDFGISYIFFRYFRI